MLVSSFFCLVNPLTITSKLIKMINVFFVFNLQELIGAIIAINHIESSNSIDTLVP